MPVTKRSNDGEDKVIPLKSHGGGEGGVRDMLSEGKRRSQAERSRPRDPEIGDGLRINGELLPPGEWPPDSDGLPPGCPIQVLGMNGDTLFLIDAMGQLAAVQPNELGQKYVQRLVGDRQKWLYWAFPRRDKHGKIVAWRNELFCEMVYSAAARRDLWNAEEMVRGRGAWRSPDNQLMWHSGDAIWRQGRVDRPDATGEIDGFFFPRRPQTFSPWSERITAKTNPALDLFRSLQSWQWERPNTDPFLMLGWIGAGMLGAALPWRPSCFVIGDKAVGKSHLNLLLKDTLGAALLDTADTTPAGIYQRVKQDCLPVAVDELEAEADNRRVLGVVRLARLAASGGRMNRGGSDHTGTEFTARNCFFFSAINPPPMTAADASRMVMLHLKRLPGDARPPARNTSFAVARMLLRQLMDEFHRFDATVQAYRDVLREAGHDGRGQDTYAVTLACADVLLGGDNLAELGFPVDDLSPWSQWLPAPVDTHENWRLCLTHLLTSRVEAWREGQRRTVGQLLEDLQAKDTDANRIELQFAKNYLAQAGLGIVEGKSSDKNPTGRYALAIPHSSPLVAALFRDTVWAGAHGVGGWSTALRQAPPEVALRQPAESKPNWNVRKVGGVAVRCTIINLDGFRQATEG